MQFISKNTITSIGFIFLTLFSEFTFASCHNCSNFQGFARVRSVGLVHKDYFYMVTTDNVKIQLFDEHSFGLAKLALVTGNKMYINTYMWDAIITIDE